MKKKDIRRHYYDADRVSVVGEKVNDHYSVNEICELEEKIKKAVDQETLEIFNKLENLHSEREAYSQATGYVQGWKDAEKYLK